MKYSYRASLASLARIGQARTMAPGARQAPQEITGKNDMK